MSLTPIKRYCLFLIIGLTAVGCNDNNDTSVPSSPVHVSINTRMEYTSFVPTNLNSSILIDAEGYHYNNNIYPLKFGDYYGFAGVIVHITLEGKYVAYDAGCPHCLSKQHPVVPDGMFAICPTCHEEFEIGNGVGNPTKGVTSECLRRYNAQYNAATGIISVNN